MTQTPAEPMQDSDESGSDPRPRHGRRQNLLTRVTSSQRVKWLIGVVVTAVVGAIATAVITPGLFHGGSGATAGSTPTPTPSTIVYKRVARSDGAVAYEVPTNWGAGPSDYQVVAGHTLGPGLTAGVDPTVPAGSYRLGRSFVGASAEQAKTLRASITSKGVEAVLHDLVLATNWKLDQCAFNTERVVHRDDGVIGVIREWRDCRSQTNVLYDGFFAPADGSYIASVQASFPDYSSGAVADHIVDTFRIAPEELVSTTRGESVLP